MYVRGMSHLVRVGWVFESWYDRWGHGYGHDHDRDTLWSFLVCVLALSTVLGWWVLPLNY